MRPPPETVIFDAVERRPGAGRDNYKESKKHITIIIWLVLGAPGGGSQARQK